MIDRSDRAATLLLLVGTLFVFALSAFGFSAFFFRSFPAREALPVVEGTLLPGPLVDGETVSLRVEGHARELRLSRPDEAVQRILERLNVCGGHPLRLRAEPWWNNAERASLVELELLTADGPEVLLSYDEALADHQRDNVAALVVGLTFGLVLLGGLLLLVRPTRKTHAQPAAAGSRVSREVYVDRPLVLIQLFPCMGMWTLFVWGASSIGHDPGLGVLSIPMVLLFGGFVADLLGDFLRLGPTISIDDRGVSIRGSSRIPWSEVRGLSSHTGVAGLVLGDAEQAERLRNERLRFRLRAWVLRKLGRDPYSVEIANLDAALGEVEAALESHRDRFHVVAPTEPEL